MPHLYTGCKVLDSPCVFAALLVRRCVFCLIFFVSCSHVKAYCSYHHFQTGISTTEYTMWGVSFIPVVDGIFAHVSGHNVGLFQAALSHQTRSRTHAHTISPSLSLAHICAYVYAHICTLLFLFADQDRSLPSGELIVCEEWPTGSQLSVQSASDYKVCMGY